MPTHRAIAITAVGSLEVVDLPTPAPKSGEVLVHVRYATLIPFDEYQLDAGFALSLNDLPRVVGFASAGFVKAVGENVKDLKEGDKVRLHSSLEEATDLVVTRSLHTTSLRRRIKLHRSIQLYPVPKSQRSATSTGTSGIS